ncbi:ribonuclease HI family protein [Thermanaerovibrio acidaminovorans]|jgi:ribonuclease HI|uniref:ribonuclease HI family protein n=1 Tax=Thermanaerovibrio acidaminovorans TaxID=81462 RepID=UPI002FD8E7EF
MDLFKGYFDGASRGNPGPAGAGALLEDEDGRVVWEYREYLGRRTNNEAEYWALIALLEEARSRGIDRLIAMGDSQLVVSQVTRKWKINMPHLRELARRVWELSEGMDVSFRWIPREENRRADRLSNQAIDMASE